MAIDRCHISRWFNFRYGLPFLTVLGFCVAMIWANNRNDPFERIEFSLKTTAGEKVNGIAILPRPVAKHPVVIYIHGSGESLLTIGPVLRQIAELGVAAIGIEYDQTNQGNFDEQFLALQNYLGNQSWAQSKATAWVGWDLGAQRTLSFILDHPNSQPQLLVQLSGGWVPELDLMRPTNLQSGPLVRCPVLLVHGENDAMFPSAEVKRLATVLQTSGTSVNLCILPGEGHSIGEDRALVMRMVTEYCRANLPITDYAAVLRGCQLNETERNRFNQAMQRAGEHRGELWKAVTTTSEPERHTVMMVIGGQEDYDLAHITAAHLKEVVQLAWQARKTYPWCRDTPLAIFEKTTANPRIYEEPIASYQPYFNGRLRRDIKYCHTTQEVSDAVWRWMQQLVPWSGDASGSGITPRQIFDEGQGDCLGMAVLYTALCRSIGLAERPTRMVCQNWPYTYDHYCTEVWSVEEQRWHELDCTADIRTYNTPWILRIPKTMILAPTGERGGWNALAEFRWEDCADTIGLVYPSGMVTVKVLDHGVPIAHQSVGIQQEAATMDGVVLVAKEHTDGTGKITFALGKCAKYPYRIFVDEPDETDWQWLEVDSNQTYTVVLSLEKKHPFDPAIMPPPLVHTNEFRR
jgi:predicted esterase